MPGSNGEQFDERDIRKAELLPALKAMGWKPSELQDVYAPEELLRAGYPVTDFDEVVGEDAVQANIEQDARANQVDLKRLKKAKDDYLAAALAYYEVRHVVRWGKDLERRRKRAEKLGDKEALAELDTLEKELEQAREDIEERKRLYKEKKHFLKDKVEARIAFLTGASDNAIGRWAKAGVASTLRSRGLYELEGKAARKGGQRSKIKSDLQPALDVLKKRRKRLLAEISKRNEELVTLARQQSVYQKKSSGFHLARTFHDDDRDRISYCFRKGDDPGDNAHGSKRARLRKEWKRRRKEKLGAADFMAPSQIPHPYTHVRRIARGYFADVGGTELLDDRRPEYVKTVQHMLFDLGFIGYDQDRPNDFQPSGTLDDETKDAIRAFRRSRDLTVRDALTGGILRELVRAHDALKGVRAAPDHFKPLEALSYTSAQIELLRWPLDEIDAEVEGLGEYLRLLESVTTAWKLVKRIDGVYAHALRLARSATEVTRSTQLLKKGKVEMPKVMGKRAGKAHWTKWKRITGAREFGFEVGLSGGLSAGAADLTLGVNVAVSGKIAVEDDRRLRVSLSLQLVPNFQAKITKAAVFHAKLGFTIASQLYAFADEEHFAFYLSYRIAALITATKKLNDQGSKKLARYMQAYSPELRDVLEQMVPQEHRKKMEHYLAKPVMKVQLPHKDKWKPAPDVGFSGSWTSLEYGASVKGSVPMVFEKKQLVFPPSQEAKATNGQEADGGAVAAADEQITRYHEYHVRQNGNGFVRSIAFLRAFYGEPDMTYRQLRNQARQQAEQQWQQDGDPLWPKLASRRFPASSSLARNLTTPYYELTEPVWDEIEARYGEDTAFIDRLQWLVKEREALTGPFMTEDDFAHLVEQAVEEKIGSTLDMGVNDGSDANPQQKEHFLRRHARQWNTFDVPQMEALALALDVTIHVHTSPHESFVVNRQRGDHASSSDGAGAVESQRRVLHVRWLGDGMFNPLVPEADWGSGTLERRDGASVTVSTVDGRPGGWKGTVCGVRGPGASDARAVSVEPSPVVFKRRDVRPQESKYQEERDEQRHQRTDPRHAPHFVYWRRSGGWGWELGLKLNAKLFLAGSHDLTLQHVRKHANPDNDGLYLNYKSKIQLIGRSYSFPTLDDDSSSSDLEQEWEQLANPDGSAIGDEYEQMLESAADSDHDYAAEPYKYVSAGQFFAEALDSVGYERASRYTEWHFIRVPGAKKIFRMQYCRLVYASSMSLGISVPIPAVPGLNAVAGLKSSKSVALSETLGTETLTYVRTVFNGLKRRYDGHRQWEAFIAKHRGAFSKIFRLIATEDKKHSVYTEAQELVENEQAFLKGYKQDHNEGFRDLGPWNDDAPWSVGADPAAAQPLGFMKACRDYSTRFKGARSRPEKGGFNPPRKAPGFDQMRETFTALLWRAEQAAARQSAAERLWQRKVVHLALPQHRTLVFYLDYLGRRGRSTEALEQHTFNYYVCRPPLIKRPGSLLRRATSSDPDHVLYPTFADLLRNPVLADATNVLPFYEAGFKMRLRIFDRSIEKYAEVVTTQPEGSDDLLDQMMTLANRYVKHGSDQTAYRHLRWLTLLHPLLRDKFRPLMEPAGGTGPELDELTQDKAATRVQALWYDFVDELRIADPTADPFRAILERIEIPAPGIFDPDSVHDA